MASRQKVGKIITGPLRPSGTSPKYDKRSFLDNEDFLVVFGGGWEGAG